MGNINRVWCYCLLDKNRPKRRNISCRYSYLPIMKEIMLDLITFLQNK